MKNLLALSLLSVALLAPLRADFLIQPNDVVGIAGDSITEQHLYSAFMEDYLLMCQPTAGQKILQYGWGGEQAPAFLNRLHIDVLPFKPTVMTTCYGMNDGHYGPLDDGTAKQYRDAQTAIVEELKKNGVRAIVLGSAKVVDSYYYRRGNPDPNQSADVYNKTLGSLADIDKEIATKEGVVYGDVYGATMDAMKKGKAKLGDDYCFAGGDGVHPGPNGHIVMAYALLKALGCDGNIGTLTVDMAGKQATGTPGHDVQSFQDGVVTIKSTRYPFCFNGNPTDKDPNATATVTTFFPEFNQDLNRYMLIVKSLGGSKAKITWGGATKEFTSDQLAKGINLANEFLQNPFVQQFNNVHNAVEAQEQQETELSKMWMMNISNYKQSFAPGIDSLWDQITAAATQQHDKLSSNAAALVVPITHTIKIESEP